MYATKMKTEPAKMLKNLWGDRFYFAKEKKWKGEKGPGGKVLVVCTFPIWSASLTVLNLLAFLLFGNGSLIKT